MAVCKGCGAEVNWLPNFGTAHKAPLDPTPNAAGNVRIVDTSKGQRFLLLSKRQQEEAQTEGIDLYTLHFASCPKAEHFRRCRICHRVPCTCVQVVQGSLL